MRRSVPRLRVAHILPFYSPVVGGMEELVKNISERLAQRGHQVHVLTSDRGHDGKKLALPAEQDITGVRVHRFRCWFRFGFVSFFPGFAVHLLKNQYDIIHVHSYRHPHTDIASWIGRWKKIPVILHGHGPFYQGGMSREKRVLYRLYDSCSKFSILKYSSRIISFTELEKSEYVRRGADPNKITVIPNAIPDDCFESTGPEAFRKAYGLEGAKIVLCVGRLHPIKSHDILLDAFVRVHRLMPEYILVLVGPDAGQYAKLEAQARRLGFGDRFRWLGVIPRAMLTAAYRAASCFVMPSFYEPFGLVLVEAMAAGVPVIASHAGGPSEIVRSGVSGLLFEPGNAADLADKLRSVLENPEFAKELAEGAGGRARDFRFELMLERIETVYQSLVPDGNK